MRDMKIYHANTTLTSLDTAYVIITNVTCMTSICGCLVTVLLYLMYPDIRTTARKMLVFLSVANFVQYIGGILQAATYYQTLHFPDERKFLCESAASFSVFGHVASALWTCAVTVYIFLFFSLRAKVLTGNPMVYVCCAFCFGLPFLVAMQGRLSDVYGYDVTDILYFDHPAICWISDRVANTLQWCFITIEGWVIAAYFICLIFFVVINCSLYCQSWKKGKGMSPVSSSEDMEQMATLAAARQLRFVPFIYCMLRVSGTAHFLFTEYPTKRHLRAFDWLLVIRAFGDNLQGFANCVLFCVSTAKIRRMVARRVRRLCACCCTWCQRQQRRLAEEKWVPRTIVRMRRSIIGGGGRIKMKRSVDGSDLDISGISLELPLGEALDDAPEELEEVKYEEDEVLFER